MAQREAIGEVFMGVTPSQMRSYLASVFAHLKPTCDKIILPSAGRFTDVEMALQAGWAPEQIYCSDVTMFSSVLGWLCAGRDPNELGLKFHGELEPLNAYVGTEKIAGAMMLGMKVEQLSPKNKYDAQIRKEMWERQEHYVDQVQASLDGLASKLKGINYQVADVVERTRFYLDDPGAILFLSTSEYKGGYTKMFDMVGKTITWEAPQLPEFDMTRQQGELYGLALKFKGVVLCDRSHDPTPWWADKVTFIYEGPSRIQYIGCNRPNDIPHLVLLKGKTKVSPAKIPLLPTDHQITPASKVAIAPTKKEHALYYRELFSKANGPLKSERYFLVLVDGYIVGVTGLMLQPAVKGAGRYIQQTFCCAIPGTSYSQSELGRLMLMALLSGEAQAYFAALEPAVMCDIEAIQTIAMSPTLEAEPYSAGMRLIDLKPRGDGLNVLSYLGRFTQDSFTDTIKAWLEPRSAAA